MLNLKQTHFLLVPDASAGKRVRRAIAEKNLGFGVKVGTWRELLEDARLAYLEPPLHDDWNETVKHAVDQMDDGFWRKSFEVDPAGTTSAVAEALEEIIRGGGSSGAWSHEALSSRPKAFLTDLCNLWAQMNETLPPELNLIENIRKNPERAIGRISVYRIEAWPKLDRFQAELVGLLNDKGDAPNKNLLSVLEETASLPDPSGELTGPQKLASLCFSGQKAVLDAKDEITFLIARDPLREIECAAGAIQMMLEQGSQPEDIGVLVPDDSYYRQSLAEILSITGNLAAGLPSQTALRDLAGEVVRSLLLLARGPARKMALASVIASPLAPWPGETGTRLASEVMAGRFDLRALPEMSREEEKSLSVIRQLKDGHASITDAIDIFTRATDDPVQLTRLQALAMLITDHVTIHDPINYDLLLDQVGHAHSVIEEPASFPANGIRILQEGQEPWTTVTHLIVLGFNSGRYPASPSASPVLHDLEKKAINQHLGWHLQTSESLLAMRRKRFQRQLTSSSESITFFASARKIDGSPLPPAETATFLAGLLDEEVDNLFQPVADEHRLLPRADEATPAPPRQPEPSDINFERDLLTLSVNRDGTPRPESPSSLEKLLVSPFAWLLGRLGAEPDPWEADRLDALLQGNIAHAVFEAIFTVNGEIIERTSVEGVVDVALTDAIRSQAPLLSTAQWKVERQNLRRTLVRAVSQWRDILDVLNARVVGVEARLTGHFSGTPIRGFCDEVLELPGGKLVVVDFKKSSSAKRRDRMEFGYDCQVSLYESMLRENGQDLGLEGTGNAPGIVYFTLNDQVVLADDRTGLPSDVPSLVVITNDVSENALEEIENRLAQLRQGIVEMNRADDETRLDKEKALPKYALEASPLIMMFAHQVTGEGS